MTGTTERRYPLALSWLGGLAALACQHYYQFDIDRKMAFLSSIISVASIFIGFLATVLAIMMSFYGHRIFKSLRATGHKKHLITFMLEPIYSLSVMVVLALVLTLFIHMNRVLDLVVVFLLGSAGMHAALCLVRLNGPLRLLIDKLGTD